MSRATHFATRDEALAAGYVPPKSVKEERYRHGKIIVGDVSGPNARGYRFAIVASLPYYIARNIQPDEHSTFWTLVGVFGSTVDVSVGDIHVHPFEPGGYHILVLFDPDALREAREAARKCIDEIEDAYTGQATPPSLPQRFVDRLQAL